MQLPTSPEYRGILRCLRRKALLGISFFHFFFVFRTCGDQNMPPAGYGALRVFLRAINWENQTKKSDRDCHSSCKRNDLPSQPKYHPPRPQTR